MARLKYSAPENKARAAGDGAAAGLAARIYLILTLLFIYLPIAVLVLLSFNSARYPAFPMRGFTLEWYAELFRDRSILTSIGYSALVATGTALTSTVLGFLAAWTRVRRDFRGKENLDMLFFLALTVPYLLMGLALLAFVRYLGLSRSLWMVWVGHVTITLPVAYLIIRAQLSPQQIEAERAAQDLGASVLQAWWHVTMPMIMPGLMAAFLLCFTFSWDEFLVAWFVSGFEVTFPVRIWELMRSGLSPKLNAAGSLILLASMGLVWIGARLVGKGVSR